MKRRSFVPLSAVLAAAGAAACADQGPSLTPCASAAVTVTPGGALNWTLSPEFSWDPSCRITSLEVSARSTGNIVWIAFSPNQNNIATPVHYAVTPANAAMTANRLEALVPGTTYQVTIRRLDASGALHILGTATFVP